MAVYNYMKLQMIRAKASVSTKRDVEKTGGERLVLVNNKDSIKIAADSGIHRSNEGGHTFTQIR